MINFRMLKLSDWYIWTAVGGLILIGFISIFSATYGMQIRLGGDPFIYIKRQFVSLLIAALGLIFFAYLDYKNLKKIAPYLYGITLLLLVVILFAASGAQGAQRWFQLGPFSFQPSEISKFTIIISLASFLAYRKKVNNVLEAAYLLFLVGAPAFLIFRQPDLGTALVFLVILAGMLTASEASPRLLILLITPFISIILRPLIVLWLIYILVIVLALFLTRAAFWDWVLILGLNIAVGIAVPFIWGMLKAYQRARILAFLNPAADPYGAGYHSLQSKIAIGSGGLLGKGFLRGTQTQLQFIPEQHSDFIFSVVGEEFGLLGAMLVLSFFAILVWRMVVIAAQARDWFGSLLANGMAVMTGFHVLANIGMAVGLLPVVGIPLPFVSFGGTSLLMNLMAVGVLQSIAMRRQKIIF